VLKLLLAAFPEGANSSDLDGRYPLHGAAEGCHKAAVKLLITIYPAVVGKSDQDGDLYAHYL
jgi:hypothetical protein